MIKPEYIFLWILFHLGAVELPRAISKRGQPKTVAAEYVTKMQYAEAIKAYKNIDQVKSDVELRSLYKAFAQLGFNDTALRIIEKIGAQFPDKYSAEDRFNAAILNRRTGNLEQSDAIISEIKMADYASLAVLNEYSADFLRKSYVLEESDLNLRYHQFKKSGQQFLPVLNKINQKWYYHERPYVSSGLLNSVSLADDKPFSKIMESNTGLDSSEIEGRIFPNQFLNRYFELSYIDSAGNFYVTTNHGLVSDNDRYLLDIFQFKFDTKLDKYALTSLSLDKWLFNYSSFVMNESQTRALYCSDMDGGFGSADIYMADIIWDEKGKPVITNPYNLGDVVNTLLPDNDPFFVSDDIIAFSSEGHIGIGGQDLFFYQISTNTLINGGRFINTRFNEYAPRYYNGRLYFTSDRSMNQARIFSVELSQEKIERAFLPNPADQILDTSIMDVADTISIVAEQKEKLKNIENYIEFITTVNPEKLNYVKGVQFVMLSDSLRYSKIEEINENSDYRDFSFLTLMHPSGDIVLHSEYEKELLYLSEVLQRRKDWMVEIRSHTDSRGTDKSNKKLSQSRADFISNYLKLLGVNGDQITSMGLGETLLLNHCIDGAPCTEEEHASNRRTELILKKRTK